jgi:2,3-bisphosphoglycerate-independent phosphoglycerate mutase
MNMRVLFLFLDGIGLGADNPAVNPFACAVMPSLEGLLRGHKLTAGLAPFEGPRASLYAIDANLGVDGLPQSATGQAVLLTGINIPSALGYHYGPKPDPATAAFLATGGIFGELARADKRAGLLNAYPPGYFQAIESRRRLYSSIPLAVTRAGLSLLTVDDLVAGRAMSADFTGQAFRERLGHNELPLLSPLEAGARLAALSKRYDFAFFDYWLSDYAGHAQEMEPAVQMLEAFDAVLGGLLQAWDDDDGLILLTSDHGNLEDLSTHKHTFNPVPLLLVGDKKARRLFDGVTDLAGVVPVLRKVLGY